MDSRHKNKTFATFLAAFFGWVGLHRFFLHGKKDLTGWTHAFTAPLSLLLILLFPAKPLTFTAMPLILSVLASLLGALVIGLTSDEKWDTAYNEASARRSDSGWPLAVLLVLVFAVGATTAIAIMARTFDLLFTGGSYG
ncbi:MAG TPA: NINE protein [Noviherbaspirillum sp.]|jgi:hypothetical protein|nr:NINE protein [Noviherbaspirillum sp.]